jgi:hypothetical protein
MQTFKFSQFGSDLGTRMLGEQVRNQLLPLIQAMPTGEKLILDFQDVSVVANSFADECLAKLLLEMTLKELKERTTFSNTNEFVKKTIAVAIRRRQAVIEHPEDWPSLS